MDSSALLLCSSQCTMRSPTSPALEAAAAAAAAAAAEKSGEEEEEEPRSFRSEEEGLPASLDIGEEGPSGVDKSGSGNAARILF